MDKQSILALELFNRFIIRADLHQPALANIAVNLWNLSQRHGSVDPKVKVYEFWICFNLRFRHLDISYKTFLFVLDKNYSIYDAKNALPGI